MTDDAVGRARAARGALERLGARVPGFAGYLERELRREMDQLLRRELATHIERARSGVLRHLATATPLAAEVSRLAAVEKALDGAAHRLRHAGSGYAGAFAAAKVREEQLEALYRFDEELAALVAAAVDASGNLAGGSEAVAVLESASTDLARAIEDRDAVIRSAFSVK
jgi:hypothetical protein